MNPGAEVVPEKHKYVVDLMFGCEGLPNLDIVTKTDAFLKVFMKRASQIEWSKIGETEVVYNNLSPWFTKSFTVDFFFETKQPIKVEVYHHDSATKDIMIGKPDL